MKRLLILLLALCALASCKKGSNVLYTVAAEDVTPCSVKIVVRVSNPDAFTEPLLLVWLYDCPNLDSPAITPVKLSTNELKDGMMWVSYPYLEPQTAYYFKTRVIQDGVNYDSPDFGFVTPDLPTGVLDMGLSVKWASTNLGANELNELGDMFAWGEIQPKTEFSWENYKWCNGTGDSLTKYNEADGKQDLDPEDDAARVIMGGKWRMPTPKECRELIRNCTQGKIIVYKGMEGIPFISNINGNTIFFPFRSLDTWSKTGDFWTSSLNGNTGGYYDPEYPIVWGKAITQEIVNRLPFGFSMSARSEAAFIRPVLPE